MRSILDSIVDEADYSGSVTEQKVRWYQTVLKIAGGFPSLTVNGDHNNPMTKKALAEFQRAHGLPQTGYLGVSSNHALTQIALEWIYGEPFSNPLGSKGRGLEDRIKEFQGHHGLKPDGQVGPATREKMVDVLAGRLPAPRDPCPDGYRSVDGVTPGRACGPVLPPKAIDKVRQAPFQWICSICAQFAVPTVSEPDAPEPANLHYGTGVLVTERHVLTAAHILVGLRKYKDALLPAWARDVRVQIGRNDGGLPVKPRWYRVRRWTVPRPFRSYYRSDDHGPLDAQHDYGVIELAKPVGHKRFLMRGRLQTVGWWNQAHRSVLRPVEGSFKGRLRGTRVHVCGYLKDLHPTAGKLALGGGVVTEVDPTVSGRALPLLTYTGRYGKGMSGGPVWADCADGRRYLIAIHIAGNVNQLDGRGVLITPALIRWLEGVGVDSSLLSLSSETPLRCGA